MARSILAASIFFLISGTLYGQSCTKVVSFAFADATGVHPVTGTRNWIGKWVRKNAKKHPDICFSQEPMKGRANYLVALSDAAGYLTGFDPVVRTDTSTETVPVSGTGTVTDTSGNSWNYTYSGTETTTTTTSSRENVPYTIRSNTLYAFAYNGGGEVVSKHYHVYSTKSGGDVYNSAGYNLGNALAAINARGRMLSAVIKDIERRSSEIDLKVAGPGASAGLTVAVGQGASSAGHEPAPTMDATACKAYAATGDKEFITENADGKILILSDGSMWEVAGTDTIDSALWLSADDVVVMRADNPVGCFSYTLINASEQAEKVSARYLGQR